MELDDEEPSQEVLDTGRALFAMFRNLFPGPPANHFRPINEE